MVLRLTRRIECDSIRLMRFMDHIRYRLDRSLLPAALFAILAYFAYHAVQGNYGLLALKDMERELTDLRVIAAELRAERDTLEARSAKLRPDSLDPEMLGERAREVLGFARKNEKVIILR